MRMTGRHLGADVVGVSVIDSLGNSLPAERVDSATGTLEFTMPEEPSVRRVGDGVRRRPGGPRLGRRRTAMFTYESDTTGPPTTFDCPPAAEG